MTVKFYITGRRTGKTLVCIEWLKQGKPKRGYPFWSRVVVTPNISQADHIRDILRDDPDLQDDMYDTYRWVFSLNEWQKAWRGHANLEGVYIDNAEYILQDLIGPFRLQGVTATGEYRTLDPSHFLGDGCATHEIDVEELRATDSLVTLFEAAHRLGVPRRTIRSWVERQRSIGFPQHLDRRNPVSGRTGGNTGWLYDFKEIEHWYKYWTLTRRTRAPRS